MKKRLLSMLLAAALLLTMLVFPTQATQSQEGETVAELANELNFADYNAQELYCPVCEENVVWTALTEVTGTTYLNDGHYYLAQSIVYEGSDEVSLRVDAKKTGCLHLNGNDFTSKGARIFSEGTLNIMGSGNVSGSYNKSQRGATLEMNSANAVINLYGGTYTSFESGYATAMIRGNGGSLNIYADAVIGSAESAGRSVRVYYGTCSQYGGKIVSGTGNAVTLSNYSETKTGSFRLYGGEVVSGSGYAITTGGASTAPAVLEISGGRVAGTINATANGAVTVSGAPKLTDLRIAKDAKIILGELTEGAAITVAASGVFTETNEKAAAYMGYFTSADAAARITVKENALHCGTFTEKLAFAEGTTNAVCPACGKEVTWTALTVSDETTYLNGGHYYLAESLVYEGSTETSLRVDAKKTGCLHLNGNDFTSKGARIFSEGTLNIMGSGNVSGSCTADSRGATLEMNSANAAINLYGGTYTSFESSNPVAIVRGNGGSLSIYEGAQIGSAESAGRSVRVYYGTCSQYGGKIVGGAGNAVTLSNYSATKSGSFYLYGGEVVAGDGRAVSGSGAASAFTVFEMYGGRIYGAKEGESNVVVGENGTMTMSGGIVEGAQDAACGDATAISVAGELELSGTAIVNNAVMQGNIRVEETGTLSVAENWTGNATVAFAGVGAGYGVTVENGISAGDFSGTLLYDYNHMKPNIYGMDGKLTISGVRLYLSDGTLTWPRSNADAVRKHLENAGSYIRVTVNDTTFELPENETVSIDLNGKTANIVGSGILQGFDGDNDGFALSEGVATVADTVTVLPDVTGGANGYRYIALKGEDGTYSFHRLEMKLTAVSLRTAACGIYYKAQYGCDEILAEKVSAYGVAFSIHNMPGTDFATEAGDINCYTYLTPDEAFGGSTEATSAAVFNIMRKSNSPAANAVRGEMPIYANAYVVIDGQTLVADQSNAGKTVTDEGFDGVAYTLLDTLKQINTNWSEYAEADQAAAKEFYSQWAQYGMEAWADQLTNIAA